MINIVSTIIILAICHVLRKAILSKEFYLFVYRQSGLASELLCS